jgi:hypothetical protein
MRELSNQELELIEETLYEQARILFDVADQISYRKGLTDSPSSIRLESKARQLEKLAQQFGRMVTTNGV